MKVRRRYPDSALAMTVSERKLYESTYAARLAGNLRKGRDDEDAQRLARGAAEREVERSRSKSAGGAGEQPDLFAARPTAGTRTKGER